MKKVGRILLCILPLIVYIALQFAGVFVGTFGAGIVTGIEATTQGIGNDAVYIMQRTQEVYMSMYPFLLCGIHISAMIVGGIWVYFLFGKKKPGNPAKTFSWLTIAAMLLCAIGIQYACSNALNFVYLVKPSWMEGYLQLMEAVGFADMDFIVILASVILAPIGEEVLFRGITLRLAKNAGMNFFMANMIQAICFGIAHLNVVQGIYAFVMGLILGYIYEKYNSLYVPILLHALINFFGTVVSVWISSMLPVAAEEPGLAATVIGFVIFAIVLAAGLLLTGKDRKVCRPAEIEGEDEYATL